MIIAIVNTGHYEFVGVGEDHLAADQALLQRWSEHCEHTDTADPTFMKELLDGGSGQYVELDMNQAKIYGVDL